MTIVPATIVISANTFWNIANFRTGLIGTLVGQGHRVLVAAPDTDPIWTAARNVEAIELRVDRSGLNPFHDFKLFMNFVLLFWRSRPHFFLGFTPKPNCYGALAARLSGVKALPNVSGLGTAFINSGRLSALVGSLYRIAFARCPIVFFQNGEDRDLFLERRIVRPDQARLLPGSGVDLDRFAPAAVEPGRRIRFLFVGRLLGDKGVREFVEAARLLRRDHPDWKFQLLGPIDEGNRSGIAASELARWVTEGVVEHLGRADDVRPFIAAATAVVLPSYREGLPRSLLEAAAMARPLVATDVPGNRQVVEHGVNGFLCDVRSPAALAEAMRRVGEMGDAELSKMGLAGRTMVEQYFGEGRVVDAYLDALAQLRPAGKV